MLIFVMSDRGGNALLQVFAYRVERVHHVLVYSFWQSLVCLEMKHSENKCLDKRIQEDGNLGDPEINLNDPSKRIKITFITCDWDAGASASARASVVKLGSLWFLPRLLGKFYMRCAIENWTESGFSAWNHGYGSILLEKTSSGQQFPDML